MSMIGKARLRVIVGIAAAVALVVPAALVLAHGGNANLIHGCVMTGTGLVRIVGASDPCLATETAVDWSITGPAGPQGPQGPQGPPIPHRAGSNAFPAGSAGIVITFSTPMANANYAAVVQPTNTAGYSPTSACTYFNVLNLTASGFSVQHKRCDDGVPVALDVGVSLNWIVTAFA